MFDLSSIILFVGAFCILAFIVHGLWFSDRPQNRKLEQDNEHDQELVKSRSVGKVRIVSTELPRATDSAQLDLGGVKLHKRSAAGKSTASTSKTTVRVSRSHMAMPSELEEGGATAASALEDLHNNASVTINQQRLNPSTNPMGITALDGGYAQAQAAQATQAAQPLAGSYDENGEYTPERTIYEIILTASAERPYLGEEIEALCAQYGFIQGIIKDNLKIYFVYENAATRDQEVFRICSMEQPYYFPENMQGFSTSAIALYMGLPPRGKGLAYFKALRMASEIFINQLGGVMGDQNRQPLSAADLDQMALELQRYDGGRNTVA